MTRAEVLAAVRAGRLTHKEAAERLGITSQAISMALKRPAATRPVGRPRVSAPKPRDFGWALHQMRAGQKVRRNHSRNGWGEPRYWWYWGAGLILFSHRGLSGSTPTLTQEDLLATDWQLAKEAK